VCGLSNESTQKLMLAKKDLTLETAFNTAVPHESADKISAEIQHRPRERDEQDVTEVGGQKRP